MFLSLRKVLIAFLFYTLLVILWGAWVRISHSGDGCGTHWPLCHGEIIPDGRGAKTWIEFTHRAMSGIYGLLVLALFFWTRRLTPKGHTLRFWAWFTLFFTITEALLGAKLVIFGLVGTNDTPFRALAMALHLVNSMLLTGSIAMWIDRTIPNTATQPMTPHLTRLRGITLLFFLAIGATGTVAALSNTLYPTEHLLSALQADLDPNSHYLVRLRGLHPLLGITFGVGLAIAFALSHDKKKWGQKVAVGFAVTIAFGILMLLLRSPLILKLGHLAMAHGIWIMAVLFFAQHSRRA